MKCKRRDADLGCKVINFKTKIMSLNICAQCINAQAHGMRFVQVFVRVCSTSSLHGADTSHIIRIDV